jgi:hypothetical protein
MRGGNLTRAAEQLQRLAEMIVKNIDFEAGTKKRPAESSPKQQSLGHQVKSTGVGLRAKR